MRCQIGMLFAGVLIGAIAVAWRPGRPPAAVVKTAQVLPTTRGGGPPRETSAVLLASRRATPTGARGRFPITTEEQIAAGYKLASELPELKRRLDEQAEQGARHTRRERDAEYSALFAKLGIAPALREPLKDHLAEIHKARIRDGQASTQLAYAQSALESRLTQLLGPEKYGEYRAYEEGHRARQEWTALQAFATANQLTLGDPAPLQRLIQAHEAYSKTTLFAVGGPFDEMPDAISGSDVVPTLERRLETLKERAAGLLQAARPGFESSTIAALESYYGEQIANWRALIDRVKIAANPGARERPRGPN